MANFITKIFKTRVENCKYKWEKSMPVTLSETKPCHHHEAIYCHSRSWVLQSTKAWYQSFQPIFVSVMIRNVNDDLHRWPSMPTLFSSRVSLLSVWARYCPWADKELIHSIYTSIWFSDWNCAMLTSSEWSAEVCLYPSTYIHICLNLCIISHCIDISMFSFIYVGSFFSRNSHTSMHKCFLL